MPCFSGKESMKKKWFLAQIFLAVGLLTGCGLPSATYESKETTEEAIEEEGFGWENLQEETLNQEETQTTDLSQNTMAEIKECLAGTTVNVTELSDTELPQLFYACEILPEDEIFQRINGCSYQENDNILLEDLRYVRVLYYGFDGATHVGELIVNREIEEDILEIFYELYQAQYPIERMELVDDYGGDDEKSMTANNTSAFNYRTISGTSRLSNHSYGKAIDLNPFYNPYVYTSKDGKFHCEPAEAVEYGDRSGDFPYKIDHEDLAWKLFTAHGFTWGGDWDTRKDYQHFEKTE